MTAPKQEMFEEYVDLFVTSFEQCKRYIRDIETGRLQNPTEGAFDSASAETAAYFATISIIQILRDSKFSISVNGLEVDDATAQYSGLVETLHERLDGHAWHECLQWSSAPKNQEH